MFPFSSNPEISNNQGKNSALRKTQSDAPKKTSTLPILGFGRKDKKDSNKHSRCKSGPDSDLQTKKDVPPSPTASPTAAQVDKVKGGASSGSPKPKRTLFEGLKSMRHKSSKGGNEAESGVNTGSHSNASQPLPGGAPGEARPQTDSYASSSAFVEGANHQSVGSDRSHATSHLSPSVS